VSVTHDAPRQTPSHPTHALGRAVRVVSSVALLSRIAGLGRDLMLVYVFGGAGPVSSAFLAAFAIPNMFRRLFGEGALSAAFIPEYARTHRTDPALADRFASLTVLGLLAVTGALTVILMLALLVVLLVAPGGPHRVLTLQLVIVMLPFMPLVCAAAILSGMLQVHGQFGPATSGPIILNSFIITVGAYALCTGRFGGPTTAYVLGAATVASGLVQCAWFLRLLQPHARFTRTFDGAGAKARQMLRRFVPVLIGMGTLQLNSLMDTLLAAWPVAVGPTVLGTPYPMDDKSASVLAFTQRLYQFPLGVFGIAVATAVFPMLARHADEPRHFAQTLRRGLRLSLFIGAPASAGLFLVRTDLTGALFSFGSRGFGPDALERAAAVLTGFAPAVWAYSLNHVLTRAFYARGDMRTPMRVAVAMVAFNLALNLVLMWPLREAGLAWSTSISAVVQCLILALLARRRIGEGVLEHETLGAAARIVIATVVMGAAVYEFQGVLGSPTDWGDRVGALLGACAVGLGVYLAAAIALRCHELGWLLHRPAEDRA
jgi:putative peptidoglycan lipid II flippase